MLQGFFQKSASMPGGSNIDAIIKGITQWKTGRVEEQQQEQKGTIATLIVFIWWSSFSEKLKTRVGERLFPPCWKHCISTQYWTFFVWLWCKWVTSVSVKHTHNVFKSYAAYICQSCTRALTLKTIWKPWNKGDSSPGVSSKRIENNVFLFSFICTIFTPKSGYKTAKTKKKPLPFWNHLFKTETFLVSNQHVYYQVSGSNSCPSSAITMWLICQNLSGQLAGETMGTSLHRDWKANSRGSFMETGAPDHKPWKTARNISCDGSKTAWNHVAMLMCTIWKLNAEAELVPPVEPRMENQHHLYGRRYSQIADTGRKKVLWEVPDGTECREVTETSYRLSENMLNQPLGAIKAATWHSKATPPIRNPGLRFSKHLAGFQRISSTANTCRKAKVDGQTSMTQSAWADQITELHPGACYYIWAGLSLKSHSIQSQKYRLASNKTTRLKRKVIIVLVKHLHPARPDIPPRWQSVISKHPRLSLWEKYTSAQTWRFGSFVEPAVNRQFSKRSSFQITFKIGLWFAS